MSDPAADAAVAVEPARSPWPRRVLLTLLGVVVVLVLAGGWVTFRVYQAGTALSDAQSRMPHGVSGLDSAQLTAVRGSVPELQHELARARSASSDPVWRLAEHVPWAGQQLRAVRVVSAALDDVVVSVAPVLDDAENLLAVRSTLVGNGTVNLAPLAQAAPALAHAAQVSSAADARVQALDTGRLVGRLADPVRTVQGLLPKVASALGTGSDLAGLLPPMLGADGPRTYLVVALNSAELRSAGGIVGAVMAVQVDHGTLRLVDHRSTGDLGPVQQPVLPLTADELTVQSSRLGEWVQDSVLTPDFPRSAQLIAAHWARDVGGAVDGVVATDPVAVSYLVGAVGTVQTPTRSLDEASVVPALLRDAYTSWHGAEAADAYFEDAATAIFGAVAGGGTDPEKLVQAVGKAASEGRFRVWSAHPEEQGRLVARSIGAAFLSGPSTDATGLFLNDGTAGKLDYYLRTEVSIDALQCTGASPTARVRLTMTYQPPAGVTSWPPEVAGWSARAPVGSLVTTVSLFAPQGHDLSSLRLGDDAFVSGLVARQDGRQVQVVSSTLAPGQSAVYSVQVPVVDGRVQVWTTPTITSPGFVSASCTG